MLTEVRSYDIPALLLSQTQMLVLLFIIHIELSEPFEVGIIITLRSLFLHTGKLRHGAVK